MSPSMTLFALNAYLAGAAALVAGLLVAQSAGRAASARLWMLPAGLSFAFPVFSAFAIATEGPTGSWTEHTQHAWGNQIWFDLLFAASTAWALAAPRAKAVGMALVPWFLVILGTGSIGLLAMFARLLYLESAASRR